jgi:hypothetical protein
MGARNQSMTRLAIACSFPFYPTFAAESKATRRAPRGIEPHEGFTIRHQVGDGHYTEAINCCKSLQLIAPNTDLLRLRVLYQT